MAVEQEQPVLSCGVWCLRRHVFDPIGRTGGGDPVRHLRAASGGRGPWISLAGARGIDPRVDYDAKAKMVVDWAVWPAFSSVEGKLGWLGEFGKCWVSKV
jgi:hypothetical protein